ncbi:hypothetical protein ACWCYY_18160 [Kitasatospora sp. NPDC001664]
MLPQVFGVTKQSARAYAGLDSAGAPVIVVESTYRNGGSSSTEVAPLPREIGYRLALEILSAHMTLGDHEIIESLRGTEYPA